MAETEKKEKKKKTAKDYVYNVIILILIIIIAVCSVKLGKIIHRYRHEAREYDKIEKLAGVDGDNLDIDWEGLLKQNSDVIGWLYIKDTVVSYPITQTDNNEYYLRKLLNGEFAWRGTVFADCRNEKPFYDFNTVLYGHHMNDGSMFDTITKYIDKEGFYQDHSEIQILRPEGNLKLKVIGGCIVNADDNQRYRFDFNTEESKTEYIRWIEENNQISDLKGKPSGIGPDSRLVMFSTCVTNVPEKRYAVWAVVAEDESEKTK